MVGSRFKKLTLVLLLILIIVGGVLFHFFRTNRVTQSQPLSLITSALPYAIDVYDIEQTLSLFKLFSTEASTDSVGFLKTLSNFISARPEDDSKAKALTIGLINQYSLRQGVIALVENTTNNSWVSSYLNRFAQIEVPPKTHCYKEYPIYIYPLKGGSFCSITRIEGVIILSDALIHIEEIIDALQTPATKLRLNNSFELKGKQFDATIYAKELDNTWALSEVSISDSSYQFERSLQANENNNLKFSTTRNSASKLLDKLPNETFAIYHYTTKQVEQHYLESLDSILTPKESEWNRIWEPIINEEFKDGLIAFRVQDSVVSSSLILQLPISDGFKVKLDLLTQQNKRQIHALLKEEGIYSHWGVLALPSPYWLNQLTQTSRDLRVIYLKQVGQNLLVSWDYSQLSRYIKHLGQDTASSTWLPSSSLRVETQNNFFIGNVQQILLDSITNYAPVDHFTQLPLEQHKDYILTEEYLRANSQLFQRITLSKNRPN